MNGLGELSLHANEKKARLFLPLSGTYGWGCETFLGYKERASWDSTPIEQLPFPVQHPPTADAPQPRELDLGCQMKLFGSTWSQRPRKLLQPSRKLLQGASKGPVRREGENPHLAQPGNALAQTGQEASLGLWHCCSRELERMGRGSLSSPVS